MRVLQVSNIVSHHQLPIARHLHSKLGTENFRFAALNLPDAERLKLGWNGDHSDSWILRPGESESDRYSFEDWWNISDIVLCGERLISKMSDRLANGKICMYMSERWWKPPIGRGRLLHINFLRTALGLRRIALDERFHYLAIGPFAAKDLYPLIKSKNQMWQWGYFTELPEFFDNIPRKTKPLRILWAGRLLKWKRVDTLIKAVSAIQAAGVASSLTIIGDGPHQNKLEETAKSLLQHGSYSFRGAVLAEQVSRFMQEHQVYVLPSSSYEGWGAVVNEAMSCGVAVVASSQSGAASALIHHGTNGLLFDSGNWRELANHLSSLAENDCFRKAIGESGRRTIESLWSPAVASKRLLEFSDSLLSRRELPKYEEGPLSPASSWLL